ncbi:FAD-binding oxidoreductase [Chimaeribacter arupi]|uniref:FAD-binding oxidoreductase n=2 Tax=Yersiniaceae TaxID=1903411 RepID=A0A2N5EJD9_9GAMM|nr:MULTISPECIES: FAD-binding oxidoreductase [Yersiniaceae]MBS0967757.1 FAD-binding oxidoreductase [Nissabacter archeti]MDV5140802.1 FAD-binding oxidoreductase [Chimaeribacter arupi]PLR39045.1 FAD-binding oxidoreductase [Chimaeribacter arupi]PLR43945.1 FAD-binding oxidoreductase [Chimaeribacter arupi]PLR45690.1 FAD-binding oxidoreductase [Chimaeribacter arupi]
MTEHITSYYAATANPHEPWPQLAGQVECDVCIVGGGFTGLSSALYLTEAGYDVVLLEAVRVGWGATGRNGGQVVNSFSRDVDVIEARYGHDTAQALGSMIFEGADIIRQRIDQYAIDCDYRPGGIFAALNYKQVAHLHQQKALWEKYGHHSLIMLDESGIRHEIGTRRYVGGMLDPRGGHLHPLNLALGEAEAIRRHGGRIYEHSAVTHIDHGTPARVHTAQGEVRARFVIMAGNAYLGDRLEPRLSRLSMPCGSQIVATEPLSEAVARSLLPNNYCVEDCNYLLDYFRLTADRRLLFGGGVIYGARDPADIDPLILPKLYKTFPQLKGVKIDYRWSGNFLLTLSRMPQFGRLEKNVYYMQGDSGHGVTLTHLAGKLISEVMRGDAERFDAFANLPHMPFFGGRSLQVPFTAIGAVYYALRDRLG